MRGSIFRDLIMLIISAIVGFAVVSYFSKDEAQLQKQWDNQRHQEIMRDINETRERMKNRKKEFEEKKRALEKEWEEKRGQ